MSMGARGNRQTRSQQRDAARAQARELRLTQAKKEKRRRIILQGSIAGAIVAVAVIITLVITMSPKQTIVWPANMPNGGITLTAPDMNPVLSPAPADDTAPVAATPSTDPKVVQITIYEDYLCPICKNFDQTNGDQIAELVKSGAATLELHPIAMLSPRAGDYSTKASNAAACVATYSPKTFWDMNQFFYTDFQPAESSGGRSNQEIADAVAALNPDNGAHITNCITNMPYKNWVKNVTSIALNGPMTTAAQQAGTGGPGTPTVLINGQPYTGPVSGGTFTDKTTGKQFTVTTEQARAAFLAFVNQAAGSTASTPTPTATP